jgi:competence protein ComEC
MIWKTWFSGILLALLAIFSSPVLAETVVPSERVTSAVMVRAEPTSASPVLARFEPGDNAELLGDVPLWYRVRLADGTIGFVSKGWTIRLDQPVPLVQDAAGSSYRVHVIDVGTGLAVFVGGQDFALLYDAGSQDDLSMGAENRVVSYIHAVAPDLTRIDHLILSHPHKDHLELLPDVFDAFEIKNVWDSGRVNRTNGYCHFLRKVTEEPGVVYHDAIASNGSRSVTFSGNGCNGTISVTQGPMMTTSPVPLGVGAAMTLLHRDAANHSDPNGNSVVTRLDLGSRKVLLAGDAEAGDRDPPSTAPQSNSIEGLLVANQPTNIRADVLVVGHHGSLTSSRRAFLDKVQATIYAVSSGPY